MYYHFNISIRTSFQLLKGLLMMCLIFGIAHVSLAQESGEEDSDKMPMNEGLKEMIGKPVPDLELPNMDWEEVKLSEVEGKVILVDFWASWCRYCRGFNQEISDLYYTYNKQGFQIISVSFDSDYYKWKKATQVDEITWINVNDREGMDSDLAKKFNIDHTPTTFLLDKDKNVIAIDLEGEELEDKIKELLK